MDATELRYGSRGQRAADACTMGHDGAALWEPGPDMWAKWPEPHLRGVDFQRTGEVDALMPTLPTPLVPSVLKPMAPVPTPPAGSGHPTSPTLPRRVVCCWRRWGAWPSAPTSEPGERPGIRA